MDEEIYKMKLHDYLVTQSHKVIRVAGGWIYETCYESSIASVFVPFDNEFMNNKCGMTRTLRKEKAMNKEFLAKRLTKFKDFEEIADYFISELEKAKKDVAEKALKAILSGNSQEIDNFRNYCKELGQTQDKLKERERDERNYWKIKNNG